MAERLTVDQDVVGSTPISHPKQRKGKSRCCTHQGVIWVVTSSATSSKDRESQDIVPIRV